MPDTRGLRPNPSICPILMCREAPILDAKIRQLCEATIRSQQAEIDQMKAC